MTPFAELLRKHEVVVAERDRAGALLDEVVVRAQREEVRRIEAEEVVSRYREALESIHRRGHALSLTADQAYVIAREALADPSSRKASS